MASAASESGEKPVEVILEIPPENPVELQRPQHAAQKTVDRFWQSFSTKHPGIVLSVLPGNTQARAETLRQQKSTVHAKGATSSYEDARADCVAAVKQIVKECRRVNMRYRDIHFDIVADLHSREFNCLDSLIAENEGGRPRAVKRVPDIFENPQFYVEGTAASDVRQGASGDCWFLAAVGALGDKDGLIDRICVARDEKVGVYGFVFHRDGEWIHTVVDDNLYLSRPDYEEDQWAKNDWAGMASRKDPEKDYIEAFQTGSRALFFAKCADENETWLPLLEKAYAKAHGDYSSIEGGYTGEGIEDLTGGIVTEISTCDILDRDLFWEKEVKQVGREFLFGCSTGTYDPEDPPTGPNYRQGLIPHHAYTILRAAEYKGERLVLVRNPWGRTEWNGRWSDGSEQWTPDSLAALEHKFGNDGIFWISYNDLLTKWQFIDRTRLFDSTWRVCQQWTSINVRWTSDYSDTKFRFSLTEPGPAVVVLSQLDDRYWKGLEGRYDFILHFRLEKDGQEDHIVRSHGNYCMSRSVSVDVDLEPGTYTVCMKVQASKWHERASVEQVIRDNCKDNQEKLIQVGLSYDLAHAKGLVAATAVKREKEETKAREKEKAVKAARKAKYKDWLTTKRTAERNKRQKQRRKAHEASKSHDDAATQPGTVSKAADADAAADKPPLEKAGEDMAVAAPEQSKSTDTTDNKTEAMQDVQDTTADQNKAAEQDNATTSSVIAVSEPSDPSAALSSITAASGPATTGGSKKEVDTATTSSLVVVTDVAGSNSAAPSVAADSVAEPASPASARAATEEPAASDSDTESVLSFASSIDSVLDLDLASPDDSSDDDECDSADEEFAKDPWNAVCVVGLKVYTQVGGITITVVKPEDSAPLPAAPTKLDVDDASRGLELRGLA